MNLETQPRKTPSYEPMSNHTDPHTHGGLKPVKDKLREVVRCMQSPWSEVSGVQRLLPSGLLSVASGEGLRTREGLRLCTPDGVCGEDQIQQHHLVTPPACDSPGHDLSLATHLACYLWVGTGDPASGHPLALLPTGHPGSGATDNWNYRGLRLRSTSSPTAPSLGALEGKKVGGRSDDTPYPCYCPFGVPGPVLTRQPVDKPAQLFLGDICPAEVQGDRLPPDDATQHQRCDGLAVV